MNATFFLMWYHRSNHISFMNSAVGLPTSCDGITWTKYQDNAVMKPTAIDQLILASPFVIRLNNTFSM
jgi:hypothetical protein